MRHLSKTNDVKRGFVGRRRSFLVCDQRRRYMFDFFKSETNEAKKRGRDANTEKEETEDDATVKMETTMTTIKTEDGALEAEWNDDDDDGDNCRKSGRKIERVRRATIRALREQRHALEKARGRRRVAVESD